MVAPYFVLAGRRTRGMGAAPTKCGFCRFNPHHHRPMGSRAKPGQDRADRDPRRLQVPPSGATFDVRRKGRGEGTGVLQKPLFDLCASMTQTTGEFRDCIRPECYCNIQPGSWDCAMFSTSVWPKYKLISRLGTSRECLQARQLAPLFSHELID